MKIKLASLAKFWLLQNRTFELFCRIGTRETGIKEKQKKVSPSWQSCFKSNTTTLDHKVERRRAITAFTKFLALLLKLWRRFLIFYRSNQPAKASIGPLLKDHYHPSRLLLLQHQRQLSLRAQEHNSLMAIKFIGYFSGQVFSNFTSWKLKIRKITRNIFLNFPAKKERKLPMMRDVGNPNICTAKISLGRK